MSDPAWYHYEDPHGIVPVGFRSEKQKYIVVGFCSPAGKEIKNLMARICYEDPAHRYLPQTTINYLTVLYEYFNSINFKAFVNEHIVR